MTLYSKWDKGKNIVFIASAAMVVLLLIRWLVIPYGYTMWSLKALSKQYSSYMPDSEYDAALIRAFRSNSFRWLLLIPMVYPVYSVFSKNYNKTIACSSALVTVAGAIVLIILGFGNFGPVPYLFAAAAAVVFCGSTMSYPSRQPDNGTGRNPAFSPSPQQNPSQPFYAGTASGNPRQVFCVKCGTRNDADSKFCEKCGAPLIGTAANQAASLNPPSGSGRSASSGMEKGYLKFQQGQPAMQTRQEQQGRSVVQMQPGQSAVQVQQGQPAVQMQQGQPAVQMQQGQPVVQMRQGQPVAQPVPEQHIKQVQNSASRMVSQQKVRPETSYGFFKPGSQMEDTASERPVRSSEDDELTVPVEQIRMRNAESNEENGWTCSKCGAKNDPGTAFCMMCGTRKQS